MFPRDNRLRCGLLKDIFEIRLAHGAQLDIATHGISVIARWFLRNFGYQECIRLS